MEYEKIQVERTELKDLEVFMGYIPGYLSEFIFWNDVMPVVQHIESLGFKFQQCRTRVEIERDGEHNPYPLIYAKAGTKLKSTWEAIMKFVRANLKKAYDR